MEPRRTRLSDRALRPPIRSPGRPPDCRREHLQQFWEGVARGLSSEEAAIAVGLPPAVGALLHEIPQPWAAIAITGFSA